MYHWIITTLHSKVLCGQHQKLSTCSLKGEKNIFINHVRMVFFLCFLFMYIECLLHMSVLIARSQQRKENNEKEKLFLDGVHISDMFFLGQQVP